MLLAVRITSESLLVNKLKEEKTAVWSLRNGLQELTDTLAEKLEQLPHVTVKTNSPCVSLKFTEKGVKVGGDVLRGRVETKSYWPGIK